MSAGCLGRVLMPIVSVLMMSVHNLVSVVCLEGVRSARRMSNILVPFFQFQQRLGQLENFNFEVPWCLEGVWRVSRVHLGDV